MKKQFYTCGLVAIGIIFLSLCACSKTNNSGPSQVFDVDGNAYDTVHIGRQIWMKQNLNATHFNNGTAITELEGAANWANNANAGTVTAAWCKYSGSSFSEDTFGKLYNWYAVSGASSNFLCPANWHVATDTDWHALAIALDPTAEWAPTESEVAGGKLKSVNLWTPPNSGAGGIQSSGFGALAGGACAGDGTFSGIHLIGNFWSSTQQSTSAAWARTLNYDSATVVRTSNSKTIGYSVRCIHN